MTEEPSFPCLDGHRYSGCVGLQACTAQRCWNGRRLHAGSGPPRADCYDRPVKVLRYTGAECAGCIHAVDLTDSASLRSPVGRVIERWTICELGLWAGPASLYNLLYHRAPIKHVGACPSFEATPPDELRPELVRIREADRERARRRRARLKAAS